MKLKTVISVVVLVVVIVAGYFLYNWNNRLVKAPTTNDLAIINSVRDEKQDNSQNLPDNTVTNTATSGPAFIDKTPPTDTTPGRYSDGSEAEGMAPDILVTEILYDGVAFSPSSVDIKIGDIVVFRNKSANSFWPASAPHPSHVDYPEFDAQQAILAGGKWQFQFGKAGNWKFHDHLNSSAYGVVNVAAK